MIKAVLFDLDGTLIDTEKLYRKYWPMACRDFGFELSDERALELRSLGRPFSPARFKEWFGESFDYGLVRARRKELVEEHIDRYGVDIKPGARELLQYLKSQNIISAVCTATDPARTEKYLKLVGLEGYFDKIISATMVKNGKPSPEVYQYACEQLGLAPQDCVAVEDAPNGVISAYEAGCRVVMVPDQTEPDEVLKEKLWRCVDNLAELKEQMFAVMKS